MTAPPAGWEVVPSALPGVDVWRAIPDDPRTREAPEGGYRCPGCGATVSWDVAHGGLACEHCGTVVGVEGRRVGREARADAFTEEAVARASASWRLDRPELHCDGCGVDLAVEPGDLSTSCAFCGSTRVLLREGVTHALRPTALVPFAVPRDVLQDKVRAWLGTGWIHPSDLASGAVLDRFAGVYLPYWTFDARSRTAWRAEVGTRKTRRVYRNGEWKTESYIDWTWREGRLGVPLTDVLVPGTDRVHAGLLGQVADYRLDDLVDYRPDFLAGWRAQAFDVGLETAWDEGRATMRQRVRAAVRSDIGSPHVRNLSVEADLTDERWRYVLLPAHLCAYTFEGTVYRVIVNGQTGALAGQRPVVWPRVWAVVALMFLPGVLTGLVGLPLLVLGVGVVVLVVALVLLALAVVGAVLLVRHASHAEDPT
jgi:DNA-directed RNA polymerase subunit RPC12/RpoP